MAHRRDLGGRRECTKPSHLGGACGGTWWDCEHGAVNASLTTANGWATVREAERARQAMRTHKARVRRQHEAEVQLERRARAEQPVTPAREPRGPLGLRLRLWWLRRRLWWMRARIDEHPRRVLRRCGRYVVIAGLSSQVGGAIVRVIMGDSVWDAGPHLTVIAVLLLICAALLWVIQGGWRTPTLDKALKEAE